jgi:FlaG/FlaF family flagellin (archaellin)
MITANGFTRPTLAEIEADILDKFKAKFSQVVDGVTYTPSLEPESFLGAQALILANIKDELYQDLELSYYSKYVKTSDGVQLDRVAVPTVRKAATFSTVVLDFVGDAAAVIPQGSIFETEDKRRYILREEVTLDGSGLGSGICDAEFAGVAGNAPIDSITFIPVPITGLDTVTNPAPAQDGEDIESDAELRERALDEKANGITSSLDAIISRVLAVVNVTDAAGRENITLAEEDGLPPGMFEITVKGGTDADVAAAIHAARPAGIGSFGDVTVNVIDSQGITRPTKFSRVAPVAIWVECILEVGPFYQPLISDDVARQAILDYIGGVNPDSITSIGLGIGESVYAWKAEATLAVPNLLPGLVRVTILIGTDSGDITYDEILLQGKEEAFTDFTKINVTNVPA